MSCFARVKPLVHQNVRHFASNVLILGAAGRDFHNFNVVFRGNPNTNVVGFTATQIPNIENRIYPAGLAGPQYPNGLKIWKEEDLERVIKSQHVSRCVLSYSDLSNDTVMSLANRVMATGANFEMLCPRRTWLKSKKPVIAVTAIRTGCGKSQTTGYIVDQLASKFGLKAAVVRHPMPYGDLMAMRCQRFACYEDLEKHKVTIEEREEYEQHINRKALVYAGVDYADILKLAESENDVIIWDGGNNDTPFYKPDLWIAIADPHRAGHEVSYYPGSVNFRAAHIVQINKANTASAEAVASIQANAAKLNPRAKVVVTDSEVTVDNPALIKGKRVLLVDDGPTLTHGDMAFGAGEVAAKRFGAGEIIDARPYAVGSLKDVLTKFHHIRNTLPAMGYWPEQIRDLEQSINAVDCDSVIIATPMDLRKLIKVNKPSTFASYAIKDRSSPLISEAVDSFVAKFVKSTKA